MTFAADTDEVHQEWTQDPVRSGAVWERVDARKG